MPRPTRHGLMAILLALAATAQADRLIMHNGDRLTGTATSKAGEWLNFDTRYGGTLKIRWADVAELVTDAPVAVMLEDDTRLQSRRFAADDRDGQAVPIARVSHINPPPEVTGEGVAFSGRINMGLNQTSGNTQTQAYHLDAEAVARSGVHRVTVGAIYNQASDDGTQSINNASLGAKYDRFISERWYAYGFGKLRQDKFKDIELRRELGAGLGHQFFDGPKRKLALEAGLTRVDETHYSSPDEHGISLRWATNYEERFYRDLLTLFHRNELTWPVDDASDFLVSAKTGVRVPVAERLTTTVEVDVDYDNRPSAGNKNTDLLYLVTLGYNW